MKRRLILAALWAGQTMSAQPPRKLEPYTAPSKLYAVQKPPGWKVTETSETNVLRVQVNSPDGNLAALLEIRSRPKRATLP